jgi:hypothetical protein
VSGNNDGAPVGSTVSIDDANPDAVIAYEINANPYIGTNPTLTPYKNPIKLPVGVDAIAAYAWTSTKDFSGRVIGAWSSPNSITIVVSPAPTAVTQPATSLSTLSAQLNGVISVPVSGQVLVPYRFVWGPKSNPAANVTAVQTAYPQGGQTVSVIVPVSGLAPSTTYVFQLQVQDATTFPNFVAGQTLTFTTPAN